MKILFLFLFTLLLSLTLTAQSTLKISDFNDLHNTSWEGSLSYKDYQSGKWRSIDATLQYQINDDKIIQHIQFTYEPQKNNKSVVKLKKKGSYFGNEKVISFSENNGTKTLITTFDGKDNGINASFIITRKYTKTTYSTEKEVNYKSTNERFIRNRSVYTKI